MSYGERARRSVFEQMIELQVLRESFPILFREEHLRQLLALKAVVELFAIKPSEFPELVLSAENSMLLEQLNLSDGVDRRLLH